MSTHSSTVPPADLDDPTQREADAAAVLEQLVSGKLLASVIVERVRARAEQVMEGVRQARGLVDDDTFQSLLDDEA
jgi:hypothetical protein